VNVHKDKRNEERINCSIPIELSTAEGKIKATTLNISHSGICFSSQREIALFRELELSLMLPYKDDQEIPIKCSGIVVRCDKEEDDDNYQIALFFIDISMATQKNLATFMEHASA